MSKYFYFAVEDFKDIPQTGSDRTKRVLVITLGKSVYASPALAVIANIGWICNHVGERFKVIGFEHQPLLDEGNHLTGKFVDTDDDSIVISHDLKGAIAMLKSNIKLCNVKL